jgi:hypothetical protein
MPCEAKPAKKFQVNLPIYTCIRVEYKNPKCPYGGHLGFWVVLVFGRNLPLVDLDPQQDSGKLEQLFLSYSTETHVPGGHLGFWVGLVFERILPLVKPNPQKKLR